MSVQTLDFPSLPVSKCLFVLKFNSEMDATQKSGHEFVIDNPGERWVIQYRFKMLNFEERQALYQHLAKLRGHLNKTRLYDTTFSVQSGSWLGNPVIDGADNYGLYADVRGFEPNSLVANPTDRCVIDSQLVEISNTAISNSEGKVRLYFNNELRSVPPDGTPLVHQISGLKCVGRWLRPNQIEQLTGNRRIYRDITLDFIEAFT